jgi:hypothetical protein
MASEAIYVSQILEIVVPAHRPRIMRVIVDRVLDRAGDLQLGGRGEVGAIECAASGGRRWSIELRAAARTDRATTNHIERTRLATPKPR